MATGKFNLGKGLLRLYLVVWMLIAIASLVGGHREVMTYLGSTHWSLEEAGQRQEEEFQKQVNECKSEECRKRLQDKAWYLTAPESAQVIDPEKAKESVELFAFLVLVVPAALLLVLVVIFKLLAWAFAGFKTN